MKNTKMIDYMSFWKKNLSGRTGRVNIVKDQLLISFLMIYEICIGNNVYFWSKWVYN
jgi:hypothetical protein